MSLHVNLSVLGTKLTLEELQAQCEECLEKISVLGREVSLLDDEIRKRESPLESVSDKQIEEAM